jgi:hypothetical protein
MAEDEDENEKEDEERVLRRHSTFASIIWLQNIFVRIMSRR